MKLKLFSFLLLAGCVSTNATPIAREQLKTIDKNSYVINEDVGGITERYRQRAIRLKRSKRKVVLQGFCGSACLIPLQRKYGLDICAIQGATLNFHMPYFLYQHNNTIMLNEDAIKNSEKLWAKEWLNQFSPELNYILERATRQGLIPNPSRTGDTESVFSIPATLAFKEC